MKRFLIGLAILVPIVVVVVLVTLYFSLGTIITQAVNTLGPKIIQAEVVLKETEIDAQSGKGAMRGLKVGNPKGFTTESLMRVDEIRLAIDISSITEEVIVINEIAIEAPEITYELSGDGSNIDAIQKNVNAFMAEYGVGSSPSEETESVDDEGGTKLIIENFIVRNGKVNIGASFLGGKSLTVPLLDIHIKDIGKKEKGATPGEAINKMVGALKDGILEAVAPLDLGKVGDVAGDVIAGVGNLVGDDTKGVTDALGGLFGK
ncbi:MAG: hypothetical protein E2O44_00405 [Nitrospina sp.]|nr:MAG: hypothetical protein E2O44_00405 [Nitrospina sp.]